MRKLFHPFVRRIPALIAAYAVILQPLFVVLSPPALAHAGSDTLLCAVQGDPAGGPALPGERHNFDCCLSSGCLTGASADIAATPSAAPARTWVQVTAHAVRFGSIASWPNERPHSARAPPA